MKYKIQRLDRRHGYHRLFDYYISFSRVMWHDQGPLNFSRCQKWFIDTYGWSAEVQIYTDIKDWSHQSTLLHRAITVDTDVSAVCNPSWSWSNSVNNQYRIYVASDAELSFFCLSHPVD